MPLKVIKYSEGHFFTLKITKTILRKYKKYQKMTYLSLRAFFTLKNHHLLLKVNKNNQKKTQRIFCLKFPKNTHKNSKKSPKYRILPLKIIKTTFSPLKITKNIFAF